MNSSQLYGILRIVLPSAIAFIVGKGWVSQDLVTQIIGGMAAIVAASGVSAVANTTSNLAKTVADVPGLQVAVSRSAAPELQKLADDPKVPDIVPATGAPTPNAYQTSRRTQ
jgi:hypothetical protein